MAKDLFGNEIIQDELLRDKFIEPPFSILDSKQGGWRNRVNKWKRLGFKSELGRLDAKTKNGNYNRLIKNAGHKGHTHTNTSIFDPALAEVVYHWFCPENGTILDPFAGGSVRGIVANYLGFKYTGIDIRQEQIDSNREQGLDILDVNNQPNWYVGDSNEVLNNFNKEFDFVFSCPPYADLEVYSDLENDISNMPYDKFMKAYEEIIAKSCKLLKSGGYACFVVGEVRDKKGNYIGFVPDTIKAFEKYGMKYYNECIYLNGLAGACLTAGRVMGISKKVKKVHQNVLIFKKP
jgi:16S rRNA G966 N2-methylase RsmD